MRRPSQLRERRRHYPLPASIAAAAPQRPPPGSSTAREGAWARPRGAQRFGVAGHFAAHRDCRQKRVADGRGAAPTPKQ